VASLSVGTNGQGFLNMLPVFLDHILFPTLSDHAFLTEVHHVNGHGVDGGELLLQDDLVLYTKRMHTR
jgi:Zn-dependent M16 (insulinase) family peptidase